MGGRIMLPDIHEEEPGIPVSIDWVGIKGYKANIRICRRDDCEDYLLTIDAKVSLPSRMRGAHMSRFIDALEETIWSDYPCIMDFLRRLAARILVHHDYAGKARVKASTTILYRDVYASASFTVEADRNGVVWERLKTSFYGNTLCPCLQQVYSYLEKTELQHTPSHMQRTRLTVTIRDRRVNIDPRELIDVLIPAFSSMPKAKLKRMDEYRLLKEALKKPRFVEDVVRYAAILFKENFTGKLSPEAQVIFKAISEESIHPYNTEAIIQSKISDLPANVNNAHQRSIV
jgi:GTP cyclohydrolase-4